MFSLLDKLSHKYGMSDPLVFYAQKLIRPYFFFTLCQLQTLDLYKIRAIKVFHILFCVGSLKQIKRKHIVLIFNSRYLTYIHHTI